MMFPRARSPPPAISGAGELLASSINNWLGATLARCRGVLLFTLLLVGGVWAPAGRPF